MTVTMTQRLAEKKELEERYEPLRPELRQYVDYTAWGPLLKHPLTTDAIKDFDFCAAIHLRIDLLAQGLRNKESAGEWEKAVWHHSSLHRVYALKKYARYLSDETFWRLLGELWVTQEITYSVRPTYAKLFRSKRPKREHLMSLAEREAFRLLPEELSVFRGYARGRGHGLSWTLDRRIACSFAHRESRFTNCSPKLLVGSIRKDHAWAYFHGENEILAPLDTVRDLQRQAAEPGTVGPCPSDFDLSTVLTGPMTLSFDDCDGCEWDQDEHPNPDASP